MLTWDIFTVLEGEPENRVNAFELIGNDSIARMKMMCKTIANTTSEYRQLYEQTPYEEVFEQLAMLHALRHINEVTKDEENG
jgi:hypothetical protein